MSKHIHDFSQGDRCVGCGTGIMGVAYQELARLHQEKRDERPASDLPKRFEAFVGEAESLFKVFECVNPGYGVPGYAHCAACCFGTGIAATSYEELEFAKALHAVAIWGRRFMEAGEPA